MARPTAPLPGGRPWLQSTHPSDLHPGLLGLRAPTIHPRIRPAHKPNRGLGRAGSWRLSLAGMRGGIRPSPLRPLQDQPGLPPHCGSHRRGWGGVPGPSACRTPSGPNPEAMPPWRPNVLGARAGPRSGSRGGAERRPSAAPRKAPRRARRAESSRDFGLPHRVPRKRRCRAPDRDPERW